MNSRYINQCFFLIVLLVCDLLKNINPFNNSKMTKQIFEKNQNNRKYMNLVWKHI